jgi:hypothetical protein
MRVALVLVMLSGSASVAGAQSTFVSGSLVGEIARFSFVEVQPTGYFGPFDFSFDGEAVGFGLAVERAVGERWGVALEFVKPGSIIREATDELPVSIAIFPPLPPISFERRLEQKRLSWNTLAWLAHDAGSRVELAFLAGVSFTRTKYTQTSTLIVPALVLLNPDIFPPIAPSTTTLEYSVDPIVGMDARFRVTDHLAIVPGVRFQSGGIGARRGWLLRPSVGARWGF